MHWLHRHRLLILSLVAFFWTGLIALAHFFPSAPFLSGIWRGERTFADMLRREGRKTKTHSDFVFLGIDQASLSLKAEGEDWSNNRPLQLMSEHAYPWSRELWGLLVDRLFQAGARLVMFDIVFDKAGEGDDVFRAALDRYHDRVVIGANFDLSHLRDQGEMIVNVPPSPTLISPPQMKDDRVGCVIIFPDPLDGRIRSVSYRFTELQLRGYPPAPDEEPYEALGARALRKLGRADDIPADLQGHLLRFGEVDAYPPRPLWEVFDPQSWKANYQDGAFFKDKIVVVGASSQIAHDVFDTPINAETPGPVFHLYALAAAMDHEFVWDTPIRAGLVLVLIGGVAAWTIVAFLRRPFLTFVTLVLVAAAYLGLSRVLYDRVGLLLMVVPPLSAFLATGLSGLGFEYALERLEKLRTRRTLERYVSKNIVKEILDNPGGYYSSLLGSRKPVTVLFSDLVGFTGLVERSDPTVLVPRLNKYLSAMVPHVFDNGGTLDKFIGDAVMAVWGNVTTHGVAEDAKAAVRAALGMRREMPKLNAEWQVEGLEPLAFGLGINQGDAVVGNIGSYEPHERLDPTVIGDPVNLASRLEALTRQYHLDILIGASAAELVRGEFCLRSVDLVQVKGKSAPVEMFTPIGARKDDIDPQLLKWLESYEEGIKKFRGRRFTDAKILFSQFLEFYPDDFLAKMYLERALRYEKAPPDESWNAVEVFTKK
ncbi:MAG TPA: adenylate/guanylate cyclase domain-containing protein [Chthoniobacterales bacterium]|nr:adenylate/guanylate cyclase domain-containing protein [Chthoniobacterales bacterium]